MEGFDGHSHIYDQIKKGLFYRPVLTNNFGDLCYTIGRMTIGPNKFSPTYLFFLGKALWFDGLPMARKLSNGGPIPWLNPSLTSTPDKPVEKGKQFHKASAFFTVYEEHWYPPAAAAQPAEEALGQRLGRVWVRAVPVAKLKHASDSGCLMRAQGPIMPTGAPTAPLTTATPAAPNGKSVLLEQVPSFPSSVLPVPEGNR
ncbi:hypothetical protein K449DRAFT_435403 [Hypoxylon sp. EC38]|nr:hypothetical protein K449DRAFT_435403 [Hypoxylon sp. EC38]